MKTTTRLLFLAGTTVAAGNIPKPDFSIGLNFDHDTTAGSLGAAVPRVTWDSEELSVAGWFDVQGGVDSTLTSLRKPPDTYLWGEAKRILPNRAGAVAIRGDMNANEREVIDWDLRANGFRNALGLRLLGCAGLRSNSLALDAHTVLASTSIDAPFGMPGKLVVNPRYDLQTRIPDATVGYSCKNTSLKMDVQQRRVTLSQTFGRGNRNRIVPTISTTTGDISLSYCRDLSGNGRVTTTFKPDDSVAVQWSDGDWDATIRAPLDGWFDMGDGSGVKLSMKRNVGVSLY